MYVEEGPDLIEPLQTCPFPPGMLVGQADFQQLQQSIDDVVGNLIDAIGGPNFCYTTNSLTVVPGAGLSVVVGGPAQRVIAQARIIDTCPAQTIALAAAGATDRMDLIQLKFNRAAGSTEITRNIRAANAPTGTYVTQVTLVAGTATVEFPNEYSVAPFVTGVTPVGGDGSTVATVNPSSVTTTGCTLTSTDPTDTRAVTVTVVGPAAAASGTATVFALLNNFAGYGYVEGNNPNTPPAAGAGYAAYATVIVRAGATVVHPADITILFPTLAPPIQNFLAQYITAVVGIYCYGPINAVGDVTSNGTIFGNDGSEPNGKMGLSGLKQFANAQSIGGDNATGAFWDGPTALAITNPPSYFFQIGVYTPAFAGLYIGYQGNAGLLSPAGYAIGGSTYGAAAAIADELTVDGNVLINGTQIVNGPLQVEGSSSLYTVTATGPVTFDQSLRVNGLTTLELKLQVNADIGSTGNLYVGNGTFGGALGVGGNALVNGNATVGGALAVSGPISGDITNTTGVPIGGVIPVNGQVTNGNGVNTLTLPTLPPGVYELHFDAAIDTNTSGSISIHGGGSAGSGSLSWPANINQSDQLFGQQPYKMFGTASGGATPAVSVTMSGGTTGFIGQMRLTATRLS